MDVAAEIKRVRKEMENFIKSGIKAREKMLMELSNIKAEMELIKKEIVFERNRIEALSAEHVENKLAEMGNMVNDFVRGGVETRKIFESAINNTEQRIKALEDSMRRSEMGNILARVQELEASVKRGNIGQVIEKINELERKVMLLRSNTPYVIE